MRFGLRHQTGALVAAFLFAALVPDWQPTAAPASTPTAFAAQATAETSAASRARRAAPPRLSATPSARRPAAASPTPASPLSSEAPLTPTVPLSPAVPLAPTAPTAPVADAAAQASSPDGAPADAPPSGQGPTASAPTVVPAPHTPSSLPEPVPDPNDCPSRYGLPLSRATVKQLLTEAAGERYWPVSAPELTVPVELVMAVAWQESGWQADIVACDGGVGLMQIMPETARWMNERFERAYDIADPADNAMIGANYLAWLTKWFGDRHFGGDYRLDADACADHRSPCLLNAVIAGYNYGFGAVEVDGRIVIPNPQYVENVRALMTDCECFRF